MLHFYYAYYNFIRKHSAIGMTSAEKAGVIEYKTTNKWRELIAKAILLLLPPTINQTEPLFIGILLESTILNTFKLFAIMEFFEHPLIREETVEKRAYQERLVKSVLEKGNTLIVAPTALGKTIIAAILAAHMLEKGKNVLMLAPTKPLAMQHHKTFKNLLKIPKRGIVLITGSTPAKHRYLLYKKARVISATPQCIENDIKQKLLELSNIGLCIFDEAHRAVGNYSYVFIAKEYKRHAGLVLALTASPGHERERIEEVCQNLGIDNIEVISEKDEDVKQYVPELRLEWVRVSLPESFEEIRSLLKDFIKELGKQLSESGLRLKANEYFNRAKLLEMQRKVSGLIERHGKEKPMLYSLASKIAAMIKANHALLLIETQGAKALWNYLEKLHKGGKRQRAVSIMLNDARIAKAAKLTKELVEKKVQHPKMHALVEVIKEQLAKNPESRIIVFNHYRDSVGELENELNNLPNVRAKRFIGQAKRTNKGMSQKEQAETINEFESNKINVLVATSVAEEGLDIPACDLVVFFEPVPSEIRHIQRRGRTARLRSGKVIILITRGTKDEAFYWSARRKEKSMLAQLMRMKNSKRAKQETLVKYTGE
jgi:Fanconi anemia group M protein